MICCQVVADNTDGQNGFSSQYNVMNKSFKQYNKSNLSQTILLLLTAVNAVFRPRMQCFRVLSLSKFLKEIFLVNLSFGIKEDEIRVYQELSFEKSFKTTISVSQ